MEKSLYKLFNPQENVCLEVKLDRQQQYFKMAEKCDEQILRRIRMKEYETDSLGERWKNIRIYEQELNMKKKQMIANEHNNLFLFVTINPKPNVELEEFTKTVKKLVERQMFSAYAYAFEQRASAPEEVGKGFHVHILLRRNLNYKPCKIKKNMENTCKNVCNTKDNRVFNVQFIGTEFARDKYDYITGGKNGEGKDQKMDMDIIFRKNNDMPDTYENGDLWEK